ncbi:YndJ family protein [Ornithinibacillus caprae]|nr:YndJ family protein [Ornithinibacillus caprae]
MKGRLPTMILRNLAIINSIILIVMVVFIGVEPWYDVLLTVAQVVFVPFVLHLVIRDQRTTISTYLGYLSIPSTMSVFMLQVTENPMIDSLLAFIYFLFTIAVLAFGIIRFINRGFEYIEECMINIGLIYIAIGGGWFLAYEVGINTGFSPILTWLTAIHFHYAAFLLPIFIGFLGRMYKPPMYTFVGLALLAAPMIVALGIAFSPIIEVISVLFYIFGIFGLIVISLKAPFNKITQKWFVCVSFMALGITILFSLLYSLGNMTNNYSVTIDFMLRFHGVVNSLLFAFVGVIGWSINVPPTNFIKRTFPVSRLRGGLSIGEGFVDGKVDDRMYQGLVDDMRVYEPHIDLHSLSTTIADFYENTSEYRLFAKIKWYHWFLPFAACYRFVSRYTKQLNLPLLSKEVEMTGDIFSIDDQLDGRLGTRAWIRKVNGETVFVALYGFHQSHGRTYMNIALPLPASSMIGILELNQSNDNLQLTSRKGSSVQADSGIYLAINKFLFRLPIEEDFQVKEIERGILEAQHQMWIFSIPFLKISYKINHQSKI